MYKLAPDIGNLELSHSLVSNEMLKYTDEQMDYFLKNVCDQQLGIKNDVEFIDEILDDVLPYVVCIICTDQNFSVVMKESKSIISMSPGDVLIFPSEMTHGVSDINKALVRKICYREKIKNNTGGKKFVVTSTIIDKYQVVVHANSEEEAVSNAKTIPISQWKHLDLYPDVPERKIIRYGKWCNFEIES
jgi:hypothetical protein